MRISCLEEHDSVFEESAFELLQGNGFDALNISRIRREHMDPKKATRVFAVEVVGLATDRNAMVDLIRLSSIEDDFSYNIKLSTRPPTTRADNIEDILETFAVAFATSPTCQIASTQRNQNEAESAVLFDEIFAIKRKWFKQAKEINACTDAGGVYDQNAYECRGG